MKTLDIKQTITGSIHDLTLARSKFDRQIEFREGTRFAVICASNRNSSSHKIIAFNGVLFTACGARLVATGSLNEPFEMMT